MGIYSFKKDNNFYLLCSWLRIFVNLRSDLVHSNLKLA